jgi:nitrate/TMAO reductase-like tetraheme cytochrome c subunit
MTQAQKNITARQILLWAGLFIGLALLAAGLDGVTSRTGCCISCHPMKPFQSLRKGNGHIEKASQQIECTACHLPSTFYLRYPYKLKRGLIDIAKTLFSGKIPVESFPTDVQYRRSLVFKNACTTCHIAGLAATSLPEGVPELHAHVTLKSDAKMHCVDCHGGMEHGRSPVRFWPVNPNKPYAPCLPAPVSEIETDLNAFIFRYCIGCHYKDGHGLGEFAYFDTVSKPSDYLAVKVGIEHFEMPPTPSMREHAFEDITALEKKLTPRALP